MAPFALTEMFGQAGFFGIVFVIGIGFGSTLEMSGFGDSRKLAAQFYFKDLTVLKVMFTAIITAMTLIFLTSSLGLLDYDDVWVNTTYLLPGIVGGLIMGVGFVIGGFCPGTSLVAMASLKLDGLLFVLGVTFGIFIFGETIDSTFAIFWNSGNMGRFTLQDWLGVDAGIVVLLVVIMALGMFYGGEIIEEKLGGKTGMRKSAKTFKLVSAGGLLLVALFVLVSGQPTVDEKWSRLPRETRQKLVKKAVFVEPVEMLSVIKGRNTKPVLFDIRAEDRFNLFHITDSENVSIESFDSQEVIRQLKTASNNVYFIISDNEATASELWKTLAAQKVSNIYILEGGINGWIDYFSHHKLKEPIVGAMDDIQLTNPDIYHYRDVKFTPKVKLTKVKAGGGGCG